MAANGNVAEVHQRLREYFKRLDDPVVRSRVPGRAALEGRIIQVPEC